VIGKRVLDPVFIVGPAGRRIIDPAQLVPFADP
jgi:hypothetical protein